MLQAISSTSPQRLLGANIAVGSAVIFVPMLYYWQECNIVEQYVGSPNYLCGSDIPGVWLTNPIVFLLYVPLASSLILVVLRTYRHKMSALSARRSVITLTSLTFASSLFIILGALFVHSNNEEYEGKQCFAGEELTRDCILGTARVNLSGMFATIEIGLGVLCIALATLYTNEY